MTDIFFSYAHQDRDKVAPLVAFLQDEGWSVWWDREIIPGKSYEQLIDDTIRQARCVVVAWSGAALESRWVHNEALEGLERHILVPLMLEDVRVPVAFRQTQAARLAGWPDEFDPDELDYLRRGIREVLVEKAPETTASRPPAGAPKAPTDSPKTVETSREARVAPSASQSPARPTPPSAKHRSGWLLGVTALAITAAVWFALDIQTERDAAEQQAAAMEDLTRLDELAQAHKNDEALQLANRLVAVLGDGAIDGERWSSFSSLNTFLSEPAGAKVSLRPYHDPAAPWRVIGDTPIRDIRLANGAYRVRMALDGYAPVERAQSIRYSRVTAILEAVMGRSLPLPDRLQPVSERTAQMVFVPGGALPVTMTGYRPGMMVDMGDYFIDRNEVTNREFKAFVDAGGYKEDTYWEGLEFEDAGTRPSPATARASFVDRSGRPGPADWQFGLYPEGQADFPVTGISWYEAVAFTRFAGKELPTAFHWNRAAIGFSELDLQHSLVALSNFSGALAPVGSYQGLSQFGLADAAGNAREWVRNETSGMRAVLGGSAEDPKYMLVHNSERPPMTRDGMTGFRTMLRVDATVDEAHLDAPVMTNRQLSADFTPVSDATYDVLQTQFAYRPLPADAAVETLAPDHPRRHYERVTLRYADGAVIPLYIARPREHAGRLQAVILFPGQTEFQYVRPSELGFLEQSYFSSLADSGRAVVWPIYFGSNERYAGVWEMSTEEQAVYYRDAVVKWRAELGRVIDYLATRDDIEAEKIAYFGASYGSSTAMIAMTQEPRFQTAILSLGGFLDLGRPPIAQAWHFVKRLTIPTLMINGRYDTIFPYEESQLPMFRTLGAFPDQKRHLIYEGGHSPPPEQSRQFTLWVVDWLDRYLGRPETDADVSTPPTDG